MEEKDKFLGRDRYGQFGADYIMVWYPGEDDKERKLVAEYTDDLDAGDVEAVEYAGPGLQKMLDEGKITIEILTVTGTLDYRFTPENKHK